MCYKYHHVSLTLLRNSLDPSVLLSDIFAPNLKGNFLFLKSLSLKKLNRKVEMAFVSQRRSTLNPDAPLFVPAAVRQVEDFSPEWWQLITTSAWFHDYWLSQQQAEDSFLKNTADVTDIADMLPDSIDTDEDILSMEAQYEQFLLSSEIETANAFSPNSHKQMPINSLEEKTETK